MDKLVLCSKRTEFRNTRYGIADGTCMGLYGCMDHILYVCVIMGS